MLALNDEQQMIVDSVRDLSESEFRENSLTWDGETPWENIRTLANRGFLGIEQPEEYGGGGMTEFEALLVLETVGRVCPDTAYNVVAHHMISPRAIEMFGTEAAKEEYLPPVLAGEEALVTAISEPEAGSDVNSMNTTVEENDGDLTLNGEKTWVTGVPDANACLVWTKFPGEGMGSVIIEFDWPGIEIQQHYTNMSGHTQTHFYMEDVIVPEENVVTRGDEAFKQQLKALNWERVLSSTVATAMAACAVDHALEYAHDRDQFGQPIGDFQGIEWKLAQMATKVQTSRAFIHQIAQAAQHGESIPGRLNTSIAKLYSARLLEDVVSEALQIHGANGYQQGHPIEYLYRMARARRIAAGTDEIQLNTIARALKRDGLPNISR